jgi:chloramphenicol-sensitive protein RarD
VKTVEPVPETSPRDRTTGTLAAIGAFAFWGLFPLYWAYVREVPALEIILHRVAWAAILCWVLVFASSRDRPLLPSRKLVGIYSIAGVLVVTNWLVYIWAITTGRTLDASLGYYINPLVSIFLGMVFLGERLTRMQWIALASAAIGVIYLTVRVGVFPWVSITLACTFGTYGLIKKRTPLSSIHSLAVELLPVSIPALVAIIVLAVRGTGSFVVGNSVHTAVLLGAGAVTVAPLLLFGIAARRIRLADVGFLQYITPTMLFVLAVVVYREPIPFDRLLGFIFVWIGLAVYTASTMTGHRKRGHV